MSRRELVRGLTTFYVALYSVFMLALVVCGVGLRSGVLPGPAPFGLTVLPATFGGFVIAGALVIRGQTPIPAVRRGLRLHPDADDPYAFRIDLSGLKLGTSPVVFSRDPDGQVTALHLGLTPMSLHKRPDVRNPRPWINGTLIAAATAIALRRRR